MDAMVVFCSLLLLHVVFLYSSTVAVVVDVESEFPGPAESDGDTSSQGQGAKHPGNGVDTCTSVTDLKDIFDKVTELETSWTNYEETFNAALEKVNKTAFNTEQSQRDLQVNCSQFLSEHSKLNKSVSDFMEQLRNLSETENQIQKQLSKLESYFNITETEMQANFSQLHSNIAVINSWRDTIVQPLQDQLTKLQEAQKMTVTEAKVVNLETALLQHKDALNNRVDKLITDTKAQEDLFSEKLMLHNDSLKQLNTTQTQIQTDFVNLGAGLKQTETRLNQRLDQFNSDRQDNNKIFDNRFESQNKKLAEMMESQRCLEEELKDLRRKFEHSEQQQNQKIRQTYTKTVEIESDVKNNQGLFEMVYNCVIVGLFGLFIACAFQYRGYIFGQSSSSPEEKAIALSTEDNEQTKPEELFPSDGELTEAQPEFDDNPLCPAVCILGFSESAISTFRRLTLALCPEGITVHTHVVHSTIDIADTPRDTLTLVFVDFNERNVILEEQGMLQGELRTKTVQHLLQSGTDVFVIYTGDRESQVLPQGDLYSTSLTSVRKHPLLIRLQRRQRVLSIRKAFNQAQKMVLSKAITKLCQS